MGSARVLFVAVVIACTMVGSVCAQYSQDFDDLTAGDAMSGSDGWELWDLIDDDTLDADVSDDEAFSGDNSLSILTTTDIVRAFSDEYTSGRWTVAMQVFIPDAMTGAVLFRGTDARVASRQGGEFTRSASTTDWRVIERLARRWASGLRDGIDEMRTSGDGR